MISQQNALRDRSDTARRRAKDFALLAKQIGDEFRSSRFSQGDDLPQYSALRCDPGKNAELWTASSVVLSGVAQVSERIAGKPELDEQ